MPAHGFSVQLVPQASTCCHIISLLHSAAQRAAHLELGLGRLRGDAAEGLNLPRQDLLGRGGDVVVVAAPQDLAALDEGVNPGVLGLGLQQSCCEGQDAGRLSRRGVRSSNLCTAAEYELLAQLL